MSDNKSDSWRLQAQFDSQGLINALKQEDAGIRRRAAAALRALGAKDALPEIRNALVNEQDPAVREVLASALDHLSDTNEDALTANVAVSDNLKQVNHLIDMLQSDEPDQVIDAAHQLGEIGDQMAVEPLVLIFNSVNSSIQIKLAVAEALLKLEGAPVEVALLAALRHTDWHIRRNGAAILGQLQAEWAVDPLAQALRDPHTNVRRTARAALQRIGTANALNALRRGVNQPVVSQPKPRPRPKSSSTQPETIPSAPRDGLLNRLRAQQEAHEAHQEESDDVETYQKPTQRLDPNVINKFLSKKNNETKSDNETDETD